MKGPRTVALSVLGAVFHVLFAQTPQPNILTKGRQNGLFLWIYVQPGISLSSIANAASSLQNLVDGLVMERIQIISSGGKSDICPSNLSRAGAEILAGVGFGPDLYMQLTNATKDSDYRMEQRKGILGNLPYTGGDIFVHAKSDMKDILFDLAKIFIAKLRVAGNRIAFDDIYGFVYKDNRDLSGFIDGTENLQDLTKRKSAVIDSFGGSYCITQKWRHNMDYIANQTVPKSFVSVPTLEGIIGRHLNDSKELDSKPATSHVARMTSGPQLNASKPVLMYRQSMPYGKLSNRDVGLFFIGFARAASNFDYFLNRMASNEANKSDDVMKFSTCLSGNYWYFPSAEQLDSWANAEFYDRRFSPDPANTFFAENKIPFKDQAECRSDASRAVFVFFGNFLTFFPVVFVFWLRFC